MKKLLPKESINKFQILLTFLNNYRLKRTIKRIKHKEFPRLKQLFKKKITPTSLKNSNQLLQDSNRSRSLRAELVLPNWINKLMKEHCQSNKTNSSCSRSLSKCNTSFCKRNNLSNQLMNQTVKAVHLTCPILKCRLPWKKGTLKR